MLIERLVDHPTSMLCECCQQMSSTGRMEEFHNIFHISLTINTDKSLTPTQKLKNFIWCYSISCLSLCLDQLSYIVINDRDALSSGFYVHIPISTFITNEKEVVQLWC